MPETRSLEIAYLICAHTDPESLAELVDALITCDRESILFIHIDGSVDPQPFKNACSDSGRVAFCRRRIPVSWCGFSLLEAQIELLRLGLGYQPKKLERFIFLSGLDFPVKDPAAINRMLSQRQNRDREFVGGSNITTSGLTSAHWRINRYHLLRDAQLPRWLKRIVLKLARDATWALGIRKPLRAPLDGRPVDVFTGSDWVSVTREFGNLILDVFDADKPFTDYFRSSFCPSEMFYHTILNNTRFRPSGMDADAEWHNAKVYELPLLTPLHFIDYSHAIREFDEGDFDRIINSDKLFARKFTTGRSNQLRSMIRHRWMT